MKKSRCSESRIISILKEVEIVQEALEKKTVKLSRCKEMGKKVVDVQWYSNEHLHRAIQCVTPN